MKTRRTNLRLAKARWQGAFWGAVSFDVVALVYIIITNQ